MSRYMLPLAVVAFSGGLDSTALIAHYALTHRVSLVSVDYGQRHKRELDSARAIAMRYTTDDIDIVDLTTFGQLLAGCPLTDPAMPMTSAPPIVPNRNAVLISITAAIGSAREADVIGIGVNRDDAAGFPDCRPDFIDAMRASTTLGLHGLPTPVVEVPFVEWTKADIVRHAHQLGAPLHLTWSCYHGGPVHCGHCGACRQRRAAFVGAGVTDPTEYARTP